MTMRAKLYGDFLDLADDVLDEIAPRAKTAVTGGRDIVLGEVRRLLTLREGAPAPAGEPPAKESGGLVESFRPLPASAKGRVFSAGFRSNHPGNMRLENGFVDKRGIKTPAHPYIGVAFDNTKEAVQKHLEATI